MGISIGLSLSVGVALVLVIFYLILLMKPELVKNELCFMIGGGALVVEVLLAGIFGIWSGTRLGDPNWAAVLSGIIAALANTVALGTLMWSVCGCGKGEVEDVTKPAMPQEKPEGQQD